MPHPELEGLAGELAKHIKSEQDIAALSQQLLKLTGKCLKAELDEHLGYMSGTRRPGAVAATAATAIRANASRAIWARSRCKRPGIATARSSRN